MPIYANLALLVLWRSLMSDTSRFARLRTQLGFEREELPEFRVRLRAGKASITGSMCTLTVTWSPGKREMRFSDRLQVKSEVKVDWSVLGDDFLGGLAAIEGVEPDSPQTISFASFFHGGYLARCVALARAGTLPLLRKRLAALLTSPVKIAFDGDDPPCVFNSEGVKVLHVEEGQEDDGVILNLSGERIPKSELNR